MAEEEIGSLKAKVEMDDLKFNKSISDISKKMQIVSQDFKNASGALDKVGDASKISALKISELNQKIDLQKKIVTELTSTHKEMASRLGANAKETLDYELKMKKAEGTLQKLEGALKSATTEIIDEKQALNKAGNEAATADRKTDGLTRATARMNAVMRTTGSGMKIAAVGIATMATAAVVAIAAIAVALGKSISVAADFEQEMSNIKAVTGASADEMGRLNAAALKAGADTVFSAAEAAQGMDELLKAGLSVEQVLNGGLNGALTLASAGGIELADAAEIAATALNAFKDDNLSVAKAADILAGASNASATDVMGLKLGLSAVASVASGMGMSFKDTATGLALFAQNGLKGSDAGTSLKTMMMNLQPATDKQAKIFKELNLVTADGKSKFYDLHGSLRPLNEISGLLNTSMKDMTDAERAMALETMFGSDAIRAGNILFKEGAKGVTKMAAAMDKVSAADVAAERLNNLKGAVESLKGTIETMSIAVGTRMIPAFTSITKNLTDALNKGDWAKIGTEISKGLDIILDEIVGKAATFTPVSESVVNALASPGSVSSSPGMLQGAVTIASSIIGNLATALVKAVPRILPAVVKAALDLMNVLIKTLTENGPMLIKAGIDAIMQLINGIVKSLPLLIPATVQLIMALVNGLMQNLPALIASTVAIMLALTNGIILLLPQLIPAAVKMILALANGLIKALPQLITATIAIILALVNGLIKALPTIIKAMPKLIKAIVDGLVVAIPQLATATIAIVLAIVDFLTKPENIILLINAAIQIVGAIIVGLIREIPQIVIAINTLVESIKTKIANTNWGAVGMSILTAMAKGITDAAGKVVAAFQGVLAKMQGKANKTPIKINTKMVPSAPGYYGGTTPYYAKGVTNFSGGLARINEEGGEIVNLPRGSNVIPHDISMEIAKAMGKALGTKQTMNSNTTITVPVYLDGNMIARIIAPFSDKISGNNLAMAGRAVGV